MSQFHADKINAAINYYLDDVYSSPNPEGRLGTFLDSLRSSPNWVDWEISEVEEAVQHTVEMVAR